MENEFINLHVHTAVGSILDSIIKIPDLVKFAVENGQKAIAITDHGYMSGFVDFVKECKAYGIKPIIGEEAYEVDNMYWREDSKDYIQPRHHLILLAKNREGLLNLFKISSLAATEGFYKKPTIEIQKIRDLGWGNGIICTNACMAGRLSRLVEVGKYDEAVEWYNIMKDTFDEVYIEIQSHANDLQMELNKRLLKLADMVNTDKIIVTSDAHMVEKDQKEIHNVFIRISQDRDVGENYDGCYLQTYEDVIANFSEYDIPIDIVKKAILNTVKISDSIENINIGLGADNQMPIIPIPKEFKNGDDYCEHLIWLGFNKKFKDMDDESKRIRRERINEELPVIQALHYSEYFIMLKMLTEEAKNAGIPLGYSRGSGANCLCLYCLGVTQVDSVKYVLDFSRFANLGRMSMAD